MQERLNPDLIRRYADEEPGLTADEVAQVEAQIAADPEVRAQVDFERELRKRIRRALGTAEAPVGVRDRVRAVIAAAEAAGHDLAPAAEPEGATASAVPDTPPASSAPATSHPSWWASPQRANYFYVAATVALIVGAVLFGIFTPSIDHAPPDDPLLVASLFASAEHDHCVTDPQWLARKMPWNDLSEAGEQLSDLLEVKVPRLDLSGLGYEFAGAGECQVPGPVASGHLAYVHRGQTRRRPPMVSIFVAPDVGQYPMAATFNLFDWYRESADQASHPVLQMSDGRIIYLLVCCDPRDHKEIAREVSEAARRAVP